MVNNEFTLRPEIIFISYDEIIKNAYPFLLKVILRKYRKYYEDFLDLSRIDNLDDKNLMRFCIQRPDKNIFNTLAKKDFDVESSLNELYNKFDDMFIESELLSIGKSIPMLLSQKFTKKIFIHTTEYDRRIHLDIQTCFQDMDRVNYVTGEFYEVAQTLEGITTYILNDIIDVSSLIEFKKTEFTNILIPHYGYNYTVNEKDQLTLRLDLESLSKEYVFKFATFSPVELTFDHFSEISKK